MSIFKWSIFLLALYCFGASGKSNSSWSNFDFFCQPCGSWPRSRGSGFRQRIVGGNRVEEPRPWMAYVQLRTGLMHFHCGGSIINKRFVLSAAHCVCDQLPCVAKEQSLEIDYEPRGKIAVIVGLKDVSEALFQYESPNSTAQSTDKGPRNVYEVVKVIVHDEYRQDFHDLALLKVASDFDFNRFVQPICLPFGPRFPDKGQGHVAGWGRQQNLVCHTDAFGPAPFTQCVFPFAHGNKLYSACTNAPTPTIANPVCLLLSKSTQYQGLLLRHEARVIVIDEKNDNKSSVCYTTSGLERGWCATCKSRAEVSDPNFCSVTQQRQTLLPARVESDGMWGLCKGNCGDANNKNGHDDKNEKGNGDKKVLREVKLSIFEARHCMKLLALTNSRYESRLELCAGHINRVPNTHLLLKRSGEFQPFRPEDEKARSKVFIGGKDSCLGDSGGPLWTLLRSGGGIKAFLVGVVSRGVNCANNDAPGIYVRVKMYLEWIKKHAEEGQCT